MRNIGQAFVYRTPVRLNFQLCEKRVSGVLTRSFGGYQNSYDTQNPSFLVQIFRTLGLCYIRIRLKVFNLPFFSSENARSRVFRSHNKEFSEFLRVLLEGIKIF